MQTLKIDAVEHWLGGFIAEKIREGIELPIEIEVAEVTGFSGINLKNVTIFDLEGDTLLYAAEGNVNMSPLSLFNDVIEINTITFASPRLKILQESVDSKSNIQLLAEHILKQKKEQKEKRIGVKINQIHIYDGILSYDILDVSDKAPGFLPSHIRLSDFTLNASIREIGAERASIYLRRLSFKERSGFELKRLKMDIDATPKNITLKNIGLALPYSFIQSDSVNVDITNRENPRIAGNVYSNHFHTNDIKAFTYGVLQDEEMEFSIRSNFNISKEVIDISSLDIKESEGLMHLTLSGFANGLKDKKPEAYINIGKMSIKDDGIEEFYTIAHRNIAKADSVKALKLPTPEQLSSILSHLHINGNLLYKDKEIQANIDLESNVGDVCIHFKNENNGKYNGRIAANDIAIKRILQKGDCESLDIDAAVEGKFSSTDDFEANVKSTISNLIFKKYRYSPIEISANITDDSVNSNIKTEDRNLTADIDIAYDSKQNDTYSIKAVVDAFAPTQLNLAANKDYGTVSFTLNGKHEKKAANEQSTKVKINEIDVLRDTTMFHIDYIDLFDEKSNGTHSLMIVSDVLNCNIAGKFKYADMAASIENLLIKELSAIQPKWKRKKYADNNYAFTAVINRPDVICNILQLPVKVSGQSSLLGECCDKSGHVRLQASLTNLQYGNNIFDELTVNTATEDEGIICNAKAIIQRPTKSDAHNKLWLNLASKIDNNNIDNSISWNASDSIGNNGNVKFSVGIDNKNNEMHYRTKVEPSLITLNNNIWEMSQSSIDIIGKKITVSDFSMKSNENGIHINGIAGEHNGDSITLELKNINIEDLFRAVNYRGLKLGGIANGKITASNIYEEPKADIEVDVEECTFYNGKLGKLNLKGEWSKKQNGLRFNGNINEDVIATTILEGYIPEKFDSIDLKIHAHNTNAEFLNGVIPSIVKDANIRANGIARIVGPFKDLVLEGDLEVSGKLRIKSTGALYSVNSDTVHLRNGGIDFRRFTVHDEKNNVGYLNGSVTHRNFKNFACDLDIEAHNLQAMNFESFGNNVFYGTAYVTGDANILFTLKDGLHITGNVTPTSSSKIVYNASAPLGATNSEFVTFSDRNSKNIFILTDVNDSISGKNSKEVKESRTNLDFRLNGTKNVELFIYTNTKTGDHIDLFGGGGGEEGSIRVIYNEKSDLQLEGTFNVGRGTYKMTMQDVIPKEFTVQDNSSINFAGNPFDAELNLKTIHNIPSVSLSDLDLSAGNRKNVSVDCLMNIGGTMRKPALTFGIELHTGNEEDRELLASATSTPEQINMQFIYLLGIGKFYTYDYNQNTENSQSSTAMESFISSTLSGHINNVLSQIIDNDNWDFSGNISTGEKGWNSMEVDGILRARMLNNRLIINGNLGYRENPVSSNNFIGDFEVQWMWLNSANADLSLKAYNKTNDRYFTKTSLNTQGVGVTARYEFDKWRYIFGKRKTKKLKKEDNKEEEVEHNKQD